MRIVRFNLINLVPMKTQYFIIGCMVALCVIGDLSAQKVKYDGSAYVVIDCSTMPGAKRTATMTAHNEKSDLNRVPSKFAVARTDVKTDGVTGKEAIVWSKAVEACAHYTGPKGKESGKWRLPNQNELKVIWSCKKQLGALGAGVFTSLVDGYYWTMTEYSQNAAYVWVVNFSTGGVGYGGKNYAGAVRCVRDL